MRRKRRNESAGGENEEERISRRENGVGEQNTGVDVLKRQLKIPQAGLEGERPRRQRKVN